MNKINTSIAVGLTLAAVLFVPGCSSQDTMTDDESSEAKVCVNVRSISSFGTLSDKDVFVTAGTKDHYVFSVMGICPGLNSANAIAVADGMGRICGDGFGRIVFRDMGLGRQSCRVRTIVKVADRDEAKMLVNARK